MIAILTLAWLTCVCLPCLIQAFLMMLLLQGLLRPAGMTSLRWSFAALCFALLEMGTCALVAVYDASLELSCTCSPGEEYLVVVLLIVTIIPSALIAKRVGGIFS